MVICLLRWKCVLVANWLQYGIKQAFNLTHALLITLPCNNNIRNQINGDNRSCCGHRQGKWRGNILKLNWNVIWMEDRREGKCSKGTGASICLQRRKCQVLLVLSEWLPADVDLILHKCTPAKLCECTPDRLYTHAYTYTCSVGNGCLEVQDITTVYKIQWQKSNNNKLDYTRTKQWTWRHFRKIPPHDWRYICRFVKCCCVFCFVVVFWNFFCFQFCCVFGNIVVLSVLLRFFKCCVFYFVIVFCFFFFNILIYTSVPM